MHNSPLKINVRQWRIQEARWFVQFQRIYSSLYHSWALSGLHTSKTIHCTYFMILISQQTLKTCFYLYTMCIILNLYTIWVIFVLLTKDYIIRLILQTTLRCIKNRYIHSLSLSFPPPLPAHPQPSPPFLQMRKQHSNLNGLVESTGAMSGTQVLLSSASGAPPSHCNAWGPFWPPILHCTPSLAPNCLHNQAPSFRSPTA